MENSNAKEQEPEIRVITEKELSKPPIQLDIQEETQEDHIALDSIRIRAPDALSMDTFCNGTAIAEGFTPGATKNIINVDRAAVYVYSATEDQIKFESRTEFSSEVKRWVKEIESIDSRLRICYKQGSLFLIPDSLKHVIRMAFKKKTGLIEEQTLIEIPESISRYASEHTRVKLDLGAKNSRNEIFIQLKIGTSNAKIFALDLSNNSFKEVMDAPSSPSDQETILGKAWKQKQNVKELLKSNNIETPLSPYRTQNFDFSTHRGDKLVSLSYNHLELIFTLFELKSKKVNCKRVITIFDLFGDKLTKFIKMARKNEIREKEKKPVYFGYNPQRTDDLGQSALSFMVKDADYLKSQDKVVGRIVLGSVTAFFSLENLFRGYKSDIKLLDGDFIGEQHYNIFSLSQSRELFYYFCSPTENSISSKIYSIDSKSLITSRRWITGLKQELSPDPVIKEKTAWLNKNRVLITTPKSSAIIDLEKEEVVSKSNHKLEINLTPDQFSFVDNILAWSTPDHILVARLDQISEGSQYSFKIRLIKNFHFHKNLTTKVFQKNQKLKSFSMFRTESGRYAICFIQALLDKMTHSPKPEFVKITLEAENLEVEDVFRRPVPYSMAMDSHKNPFYSSEGFLIYSEQYPVRRDSLQRITVRGPCINLSTLNFELLDSSLNPLNGTCKPDSHIVRVKNGQIISTQVMKNEGETTRAFLLRSIDKKNRKLVLNRILKIEINWRYNIIRSAGLGFCCYPGYKFENPVTVAKFSEDLKEVEAVSMHWSNDYSGLTSMDNGNFILTKKRHYRRILRNNRYSSERLYLELDIGAKALRPLSVKGCDFSTQKLTSHGQERYLYDFKPNELVLSRLGA